jgi:hypothetical protein
MIPQNLHWAFEEGRRVHTLAGTGRMKRHDLASLVLPTGKISTGYPGDDFSNKPNTIYPQVSPGTYPVSINVVRNHKESAGAFAFVAVSFIGTKTTSWEAMGQFFTDSGDGCIFDASVIDLLRKKRAEMSREEWGSLKTSALRDGNGNLILNENTGVNAIIFKAGDWSYNCFIGHDSQNQISSLVIDGRTQESGETKFKSLWNRFHRK